MQVQAIYCYSSKPYALSARPTGDRQSPGILTFWWICLLIPLKNTCFTKKEYFKTHAGSCYGLRTSDVQMMVTWPIVYLHFCLLDPLLLLRLDLAALQPMTAVTFFQMQGHCHMFLKMMHIKWTLLVFWHRHREVCVKTVRMPRGWWLAISRSVQNVNHSCLEMVPTVLESRPDSCNSD